MSSITLALTGETSSLNAYFHPEIELDERFNYVCGLLDFYTYNSVANVHEKNNIFRYTYKQIDSFLEIPVGSYEIDEIATIINNHFNTSEIPFIIKGNKNTMKCEIKSSRELIINFDEPNSIGSLLGFNKNILMNETHYKSDRQINVTHINTIRINCDLITGSYHNGESTHTIYEFNPDANPGEIISEKPRNIIYLPVVRCRINTLNISVTDQLGNPIDFRGETITCRLHLKRDI